MLSESVGAGENFFAASSTTARASGRSLSLGCLASHALNLSGLSSASAGHASPRKKSGRTTVLAVGAEDVGDEEDDPLERAVVWRDGDVGVEAGEAVHSDGFFVRGTGGEGGGRG